MVQWPVYLHCARERRIKFERYQCASHAKYFIWLSSLCMFHGWIYVLCSFFVVWAVLKFRYSWAHWKFTCSKPEKMKNMSIALDHGYANSSMAEIFLLFNSHTHTCAHKEIEIETPFLRTLFVPKRLWNKLLFFCICVGVYVCRTEYHKNFYIFSAFDGNAFKQYL